MKIKEIREKIEYYSKVSDEESRKLQQIEVQIQEFENRLYLLQKMRSKAHSIDNRISTIQVAKRGQETEDIRDSVQIDNVLLSKLITNPRTQHMFSKIEPIEEALDSLESPYCQKAQESQSNKYRWLNIVGEISEVDSALVSEGKNDLNLKAEGGDWNNQMRIMLDKGNRHISDYKKELSIACGMDSLEEVNWTPKKKGRARKPLTPNERRIWSNSNSKKKEKVVYDYRAGIQHFEGETAQGEEIVTDRKLILEQPLLEEASIISYQFNTDDQQVRALNQPLSSQYIKRPLAGRNPSNLAPHLAEANLKPTQQDNIDKWIKLSTRDQGQGKGAEMECSLMVRSARREQVLQEINKRLAEAEY